MYESRLDERKARTFIEAKIGRSIGQEGGETNYRCPFCVKAGRSKIGTLHVNYKKGMALCHSCLGASKSLSGFIKYLYGEMPKELGSIQFSESLEDDVMGILYPAVEDSGDDGEDAEVKLPESFVKLTRKPKDTLGKFVLDYLTATGESKSGDRARGIPFDRLEEVGVGYCTSGKFSGYAIFPIHIDGRLITFTSRRVLALRGKAMHNTGGVTASVALFNYDNCKDCKRIFVGEGPFDAWALHRRLRPTDGGVGMLGTRAHVDQGVLLGRIETCEEIVVYLDADANDKALSAAKMFHAVTGKKVSLITHDGKDPDELSIAELVRVVKSRKEYTPDVSEIERMLAW